MRFLKEKKGIIISFITGVILASSITVYATGYLASQIIYTTNKDSEIKNVSEALNDLYNKYSQIGITKKASELEYATNTITNNSKEELYVALIAYTSSTDASNIISARTQIKSISGATSNEIMYSYNSDFHIGIRLYKIINCQETISIASGGENNTSQGFIIYLSN